MQEKDFPEQDELILCTVDRILGTTVFVKIDDYNKEGIIATSEVAPGRIRNIRDYVRVGKKIVCKVLRVSVETGHIDLSLRRVSLKERNKILSDFEREKNALAIMKSVLKERTEEIVNKIKKDYSKVLDFLQNASPDNLKNLGINETETEQILKIVKEKPSRNVSVKAHLILSSDADDGMIRIKNILSNLLEHNTDVDIVYLSSPNYSITVTSSDYKEANRKMDAVVEEISADAKTNGCRIEVKR
jgi:translation initiation factor 2 subunit 1